MQNRPYAMLAKTKFTANESRMTYQLLKFKLPTPVNFCSQGAHRISNMIAVLLLCATSGSVLAETYTWTDEYGVVNYSERMPRGVPTSRVSKLSDNALPPSSNPTPPLTYSPSSSSVSSSSTPPRTPEQPDLSEEQQQMMADLQTAEDERVKQLAALRQDNCDRARRVLSNLSQCRTHSCWSLKMGHNLCCQRTNALNELPKRKKA